MKINENYKIHRIAGENIIVNQGTANVDMTRIISLNETACKLYRELAEREFTTGDAARVLTEAYRIDEEQALADAAKWVEELKSCGVIE